MWGSAIFFDLNMVETWNIEGLLSLTEPCTIDDGKHVSILPGDFDTLDLKLERLIDPANLFNCMSSVLQTLRNLVSSLHR